MAIVLPIQQRHRKEEKQNTSSYKTMMAAFSGIWILTRLIN